MISIYFAGPAVFRADVADYAIELKNSCRDLSVTPLWPLDNDPGAGDQLSQARRIRELNCDMVRRADALVADVSPFRGVNMDPGTAFEIGFAAALGKPVFLYTNDRRTLLDRTRSALDLRQVGDKLFDAHRMEVEDFGLAENLMIAAGVDRIYGDRREATEAARLGAARRV